MRKSHFSIFLYAGVFITILSYPLCAQETNLLANGGFEEQSSKITKGNFCLNWPVSFGSKARECHAELSKDAYRGKYSLKLVLKGSGADVWSGQKIKVVPGIKLNFRLYAKGSPKGKFYVQFIPMKGGKNVGNTYIFFPLSAVWRQAAGSYSVPGNADELQCLIHMVGSPAEGYFDEFEVFPSPGNTLANRRLIVTFNSLLGGCIDGLIDRKNNFNYTWPRQAGGSGGMGIDILPGDSYPGVFSNALYRTRIMEPYRKIRFEHTCDFGTWRGIRISKTYSLPSDEKCEVKVHAEVKNESGQARMFFYRVQNFLHPADGIFSFPGRDWLTVFDKSPESIRTINSLVLDNLRTGWCAKAYKTGKTVVFRFDNKSILKAYSYLTGNFDTLEWYYDKITLQTGETWKFGYSISLKSGVAAPYSDGFHYPRPPVEIKGVKVPPPENTKRELPDILQGYFPYAASLSNVVTPETAGNRSDVYRHTYLRQVRELAEGYFNNFYSAHLFTDFRFFEELASAAARYDMTITPNVHIVGKDDVDVEKYLAAESKLTARYNMAVARGIIRKYKDRILCYYTGDEITSQNIGCMLAGHDLLRRELNHPDAAFFPYLNLSSTTYEMARYLQVYLGDLYPVYEAETLTRNPWAVGKNVEDAVRKLSGIPVWFMPQAFASGKIYGLPEAAEMRLMIYSAVASGAKGIILYGLNGTSCWLVKAGGETLPMQTALGSRLPQWETLTECGRELTAVGPRLFYTSPEWDYRETRISSAGIRRKSRNVTVYDGPAILLRSLKHREKNLRYLIAVNQDERRAQNAILTFPHFVKGLKCYDLTHMRQVASETHRITLAPGDAVFFILAHEDDLKREVEAVFTNRFRRERIRYRIAAERAARNGIDVPALPEGKGWKAYQSVMSAQKELQERIARTDYGKMLKQWHDTRELLASADFLLIRNSNRIISGAIQKKTPNFRKYPRPADSKLSPVLAGLEDDFLNFWKLDRAIENGQYSENRHQIQALIDKVQKDVKNLSDYFPK